jgi:hypothetical protein
MRVAGIPVPMVMLNQAGEKRLIRSETPRRRSSGESPVVGGREGGRDAGGDLDADMLGIGISDVGGSAGGSWLTSDSGSDSEGSASSPLDVDLIAHSFQLWHLCCPSPRATTQKNRTSQLSSTSSNRLLSTS